ncbi:hypothetical protein SAMN05444415_10530 [Salipiger profundus]|nr:hypothetical protein SAMN05444415_10530 [Salipiger profundus]
MRRVRTSASAKTRCSVSVSTNVSSGPIASIGWRGPRDGAAAPPHVRSEPIPTATALAPYHLLRRTSGVASLLPHIEEDRRLGFRICYLASRASPEELAESLNLSIGDPAPEMPDSEWWIAKLKKNGWTILWSEDEGFGERAVEKTAALSRQHATYICEVNETVMWSSAAYWKDGRQVWKVTHAGDGEDILDLSETGTLPDGYLSLKQRHTLAQKTDGEGVDHIFEIPLDLAALDFGFRHEDHLEPSDVVSFLTIAAPHRKSLLSRILGR